MGPMTSICCRLSRDVTLDLQGELLTGRNSGANGPSAFARPSRNSTFTMFAVLLPRNCACDMRKMLGFLTQSGILKVTPTPLSLTTPYLYSELI